MRSNTVHACVAGFVLLGFVVLSGGCAPAARLDYVRALPPGESLFAGDQAVMPDDQIARVLNTRTELPPKLRVAVMRSDDRSRWSWWSEEMSRLDADSVAGLLGKLRACGRVADASVLPSMLMPPMRNVPHLRVAAARYQADLLVIYGVTTRTYERQQFLREKEAKARCLIELVVLDVRSGIVPFATSTVETFVAAKGKDDFNESETMYKAELEATSRGLDRIAAELVTFLERVPVTQAQ